MSNTPPVPSDALPGMDSRWYRLCHDLLYIPAHLAFTLGFSLRVQGQRNVPMTGPALLVANHQSFLDPVLIGLAAYRPLVYLARKTLFRKPAFAAMIRLMNAVPIDHEGIGKEGIRMILQQLQLGKAVVIFPEGTRTPDGNMQALRAGVHLLIKRVHVPIVPVGIAGAYDAWPNWRKYPIPAPLFMPGMQGTLSISLGKPLDSQRYAEMPRAQALQELFDSIQTEQTRAEKRRRR